MGERVPGPLTGLGQSGPLLPGISMLAPGALPGPSGATPLASALLGLTVDVGDPIQGGSSAPPHTRFYALTAGLASSVPIYIEAKFSGATAPPLQWIGGQPGSDDTERLLLTKDPGKFVITCSDGRVTVRVVIYVVAAVQSGFRGDGGGQFHTDNLKSLKREDGKVFPIAGRTTGRKTPTGANLDFNDLCESQYTVQPPELVADAKAGVIQTDPIHFLVTRERQIKSFLGLSGGTWSLIKQEAAFLPDTDSRNQMNDPFTSDGHLYCNDGPGMEMTAPLAIGDKFVFKVRLRERVKVTFDDSDPVNGWVCSDQFSWHDFRSLQLAKGKWSEVGTFGGNELASGERDFGSLPM